MATLRETIAAGPKFTIAREPSTDDGGGRIRMGVPLIAECTAGCGANDAKTYVDRDTGLCRECWRTFWAVMHAIRLAGAGNGEPGGALSPVAHHPEPGRRQGAGVAGSNPALPTRFRQPDATSAQCPTCSADADSPGALRILAAGGALRCPDAWHGDDNAR